MLSIPLATWLATWLVVGAPALAAGPQATELRTQTWPDGRARVELSVESTEQGERPHGPYRRYHQDGTLAAEGAYAHGELDGPWTTWWPDGTVRTRGTFLEGRRTGKWESFHPSGQLAETGRYRLGLRDRKWVYLTPEGEKLEGDSGLYRTFSALYEDRDRMVLAELRGDVLHGRWLSWWDRGGPLLEGSYRDGLREGRFSFHLLDGSLDPEVLSGIYHAGERVAPLPPEPDPDPFGLPEEQAAHARSLRTEPDPARLPRFGRPPGVDARQRAALAEKVARFLEHDDERERRLTEQLLLQHGRDAVPELLNRLAELDLAEPVEYERAERVMSLLRGICRGRGYGLSGEPEADRRAVARWCSWFELARLQEPWWEALRSGALPPELITMELVEGLIGDAPGSATGTAPEEATPPIGGAEITPKLSMLFRRRLLETRPREIREPVERGLAWLATHQSPEGGWDADGFGATCERRGQAACDGEGQPYNDVGVTALALLAFMADGQTVHAGTHSEVVARGLRWLIERQDPTTGRILAPKGHDHGGVYGHALATLALCEAATFTDSDAVRVPARRAVEVILGARNPDRAWRYSFEPDGDNDTSVTGWMVQALHAAREAELAEPAALDRAMEGAAAWFAGVTERGSGVIGYYAPGSGSARVEGVNDHYPAEAPTMTAVGVFAGLLTGARKEQALLERQADLMLMHLPRADAEQPGDFYYWMHGTEAMAQVGGRHWKAWRAALWRALLEIQREERAGACVQGSWDPAGPWGWSGGRVYSTAMAILALEGEFRTERVSH